MDSLFQQADQILDAVTNHSAVWIYLITFAAMLVENFFPPFPGDLIVFICGAYAAAGHASWSGIYVVSVLGTLASAMTLYYIGLSKGRDVLQSHRLRFLGVKRLEKVEHWYARWGEKLLLVSRWLTGVRALLALFAGVGRVKAGRMFLYTLFAAMTYNLFLLLLAQKIRRDWHKISGFFHAYDRVIWIALIVVVVIIMARYFLRRRRMES